MKRLRCELGDVVASDPDIAAFGSVIGSTGSGRPPIPGASSSG